MTRARTSLRFRAALCGLVTCYLVIATAYSFRLPLIMDEFQGANAVDRLLSGLPYRDFAPYKNVLGYYLQLPVLATIRDPWWGPVGVRLSLVLLNAACLVMLARRLRRAISPAAALLAVSLLACMTTFLERGHELRVDQLTGWLAAFGLLSLVDQRPGRAGLLLGLAFLVSQKAALFVVAGAVAAITLDLDRDGIRPHATTSFIRAGALIVLGYVTLWSVVAGPERVLGAMFPDALEVASRDPHMRRWWMWLQSGLQNPVFWVSSLGGIFAGFRRGTAPRGMAVYTATLLGLALAHRQPWPYFIASLAPVMAVSGAVGADALVGMTRDRRVVWGALVTAWVVLGLGFSLSFVPTLLRRSNAYQRDLVRTADEALGTHGSYLAGVHIVRFRRHEPPSLGWLDAGRLARLHAGGEVTARAYLDSLESRSPDLVIDNYRLRLLPCSIRQYLDRRYVEVAEGIYARHGARRRAPADGAPRNLFPLVNDYGARLPPGGLRLPPGGLAAGCTGGRLE